MGKSGIITEEFKGEENTSYHDIIALFKIYRSVNWRIQIKINQDLAGEKERIEAINRSN